MLINYISKIIKAVNMRETVKTYLFTHNNIRFYYQVWLLIRRAVRGSEQWHLRSCPLKMQCLPLPFGCTLIHRNPFISSRPENLSTHQTQHWKLWCPENVQPRWDQRVCSPVSFLWWQLRMDRMDIQLWNDKLMTDNLFLYVFGQPAQWEDGSIKCPLTDTPWSRLASQGTSAGLSTSNSSGSSTHSSNSTSHQKQTQSKVSQA